MKDLSLIEGLNRRDKVVFDYLFNYYYSSLCAFSMHYIKDQNAVEDLVQDFFVSLWMEASDLKICSSLKSYLFSGVKNRCLDLKKHQKVTEKYRNFEALKEVNNRMVQSSSPKWWIDIQRAAAILLLPLLIYSGYVTLQNYSMKNLSEEQVMMQTITSRQGMVTRFALADGTKVWLNSCSELRFPIRFTGKLREVKLTGEAYFEVTKNTTQTFRVNAKELNVDVLGTSFNVINYSDDTQSEVILVEGKVILSANNEQVKKEYGTLWPGQRAIYDQEIRKVFTEVVDVDKYMNWRDGNLIFRDDNMEDVVKRLSRWFNVEIVIVDPEIKSYI